MWEQLNGIDRFNLILTEASFIVGPLTLLIVSLRLTLGLTRFLNYCLPASSYSGLLEYFCFGWYALMSAGAYINSSFNISRQKKPLHCWKGGFSLSSLIVLVRLISNRLMRRNRTGCPVAVRSPDTADGGAHRIAVLLRAPGCLLPHEHPVCLAVFEFAGLSGLRRHYCAPAIVMVLSQHLARSVRRPSSGGMSVPIFLRHQVAGNIYHKHQVPASVQRDDWRLDGRTRTNCSTGYPGIERPSPVSRRSAPSNTPSVMSIRSPCHSLSSVRVLQPSSHQV